MKFWNRTAFSILRNYLGIYTKKERAYEKKKKEEIQKQLDRIDRAIRNTALEDTKKKGSSAKQVDEYYKDIILYLVILDQSDIYISSQVVLWLVNEIKPYQETIEDIVKLYPEVLSEMRGRSLGNKYKQLFKRYEPT